MNQESRKLLQDILQEDEFDTEVLNRTLRYVRSRKRLKTLQQNVALFAIITGTALSWVFYSADEQRASNTEANRDNSLFMKSRLETVTVVKTLPNVPLINSVPLETSVKALTDEELVTFLEEHSTALFQQPGSAVILANQTDWKEIPFQ